MLRLVVFLGLLAGLRRNEIFALSWDNIDYTNNVIRIRKNLFWRHGKYQSKRAGGEPAWILHSPKTMASVRDVDMSPVLKRELQAYYLRSEEKSGLIFRTSNDGPLDPHNFYERQFKACVHSDDEKKMDLNWTDLHTAYLRLGEIGTRRESDLRIQAARPRQDLYHGRCLRPPIEGTAAGSSRSNRRISIRKG